MPDVSHDKHTEHHLLFMLTTKYIFFHGLKKIFAFCFSHFFLSLPFSSLL